MDAYEYKQLKPQSYQQFVDRLFKSYNKNMNEEKVLVLIDADSLVYSSSKESLKESIEIIDDKVQNIFDKTGADYYSMFISLGTYFRHTVDPGYKAQRKSYPTQLLWTRTLKNYLIERYGAVAGKNVEADDLVAYFNNKKIYEFVYKTSELFDNTEEVRNLGIVEEGTELSLNTANGTTRVKTIVSSPDKDLLQSIPGKHFNYSYFLADKTNVNSLVRGSWVETSELEVNEFCKMQMIVGDAGDNVGALVGKGPAYWKKLSNNGIPTWGDILHEYINHHKDISVGISEFNKNYKLLHLLDSDSDFLREVGYLPEFKYYAINKPVVNKDEVVF